MNSRSAGRSFVTSVFGNTEIVMQQTDADPRSSVVPDGRSLYLHSNRPAPPAARWPAELDLMEPMEPRVTRPWTHESQRPSAPIAWLSRVIEDQHREDPILDVSTYAAPRDFPVDCAVCMEKIRAAEIVTTSGKCFHSFHANCMGEWIARQATCPTCRSQLSP